MKRVDWSRMLERMVKDKRGLVNGSLETISEIRGGVLNLSRADWLWVIDIVQEFERT